MTTPTNPACTPPTNTRAPLWSRASLICPPGLTPAQNKAEVLQYKGNANPLTKKQQLSRNIRGFGPLGNKVWATQNDYGSNPNVFNLEQQGNTLILCPPCPSGIQILDISDIAIEDLEGWTLKNDTTIITKCQNLVIKIEEYLNISNKILIVEGTITNNGTIENFDNSIFNNFGIIYNTLNGSIYNDFLGEINNFGSGIIYNNGLISTGLNTSKFNNYGTIYNYNNGTITNYSTLFINSGTINNANGLSTCGTGILNGTIPITATGTLCPPSPP
jgi:hypothetical protein